MHAAWARYRPHLVTLVAGLALGIAAYARLGPDAARLDAGVQSALLLLISVMLAATAGAAGALLGATIAADAARETARISQAEAQADRDEAREARFNDRTRELAAQLLVSGTRYRAGAERQVNLPANQQARQPLHLGATAGETQRELRLIVRSQTAYDATNRFGAAIATLMDFVYDEEGENPPPELGNRTGFRDALHEFQAAADAFETATRVELGGAALPDPSD